MYHYIRWSVVGRFDPRLVGRFDPRLVGRAPKKFRPLTNSSFTDQRLATFGARTGQKVHLAFSYGDCGE